MAFFPFHTLLLAAYPVLFVFSKNSDFIALESFTKYLFISLGAAAVILAILTPLANSLIRAAVFISTLMISFILWGPVSIVTNDICPKLGCPLPQTEIVVGILWSTIFISMIFSLRFLKDSFIKAISLFLNVLTVVSVAPNGIRDLRLALETNKPTTYKSQNNLLLANQSPLPNIYYIILDGYGRSDVLKEIYKHDNSGFLAHLSDRGFFVAKRSSANYIQTMLSLASSLNTNYIDQLTTPDQIEDGSREPLIELIQNNQTMSLLKKIGYQFVGYSSGFLPTEFTKADFYLTGDRQDTMLDSILGLSQLPYIRATISQKLHAQHRERELFILDHLADSTKLGSPIFVFAHIILPHPPFVFGPNGESITPDKMFSIRDANNFGSRELYPEQYKNQLVFLNSKVEKIVGDLISQSPTPPIIIIQGDHGPGSRLDWTSVDKSDLRERFGILNAYYFPGKDYTFLYDTISPVNSFRVVQNLLFKDKIPLLSDRHLFSSFYDPYDFTDVTGKVDQLSKDSTT